MNYTPAVTAHQSPSSDERRPMGSEPSRQRVHYTYRPTSTYTYGPVPRSEKEWRSGAPLDDGYYPRWTDGGALSRVLSLWRKYASMVRSNLPTSVNAGSIPALATTSIPTIAPSLSSVRFVVLCMLWYTSSAMSSNTAKPLLSLYRYPVTLTFLQFGFVAAYCFICFSPVWKLSTLRSPTRAILKSTVPMALFQVGGHIFSSMAISRVPVSTVHTIKALSPLLTVGAYAFLFGVTYSPATYFSLVPLTVGVMLACTFDMTISNAFGLICAFASALVVVSSNIFFKKIMPSKPSSGGHMHGPSHKLDKLNLLFYTSGLAFVLMIPLWLYSDMGRLWADLTTSSAGQPASRLSSALYYLFMNVTVHFAQNLIAFALLSITSPVTYSIASLVKRIAVICIAILWFNQRVHPIQGLGIGLAGVGLWMYNNAKADVEKGEKRAQRVSIARDLQLPLSRMEVKSDDDRIDEQSNGDHYSKSTSITRAQDVPLTARGAAPWNFKPPAITIPSYGHGATLSPADNYPSPPDSRDSPPMRASVPSDKSHHAVPMFDVDKSQESYAAHEHRPMVAVVR